jgi:hypothetical protein
MLSGPARLTVALSTALLLAACSGGGGGATPGGGGGGCSSAASCPGTDTTCRYRTCVAGACGMANAPGSTACAESGGQVCDGAGACVLTCALSNPCVSPPPPACSGDVRVISASPGTCAFSPSAPGYTCTYGSSQQDCAASGSVCRAGACVPSPSAQVQAVRDAAASCALGCTVSLPVQGALVSYVRPAIGGESAAFYLQDRQSGPALLVAVDPATVGGGLAVGDRVDLVITGVGMAYGEPVAAAASVVRQAQGVDVTPLIQDLSTATDVVSALDAYVDELVTITVVLTGGYGASGTGFVEFPVVTAGYPGGDANLRLRVRDTLPDLLDLVPSCRVRVGPAPLGRYNATAEATARAAAELTGIERCPAPQVVSAVATATSEVRITFDRRLDPGSVLADGSQVTFGGGLTAVAATALGRELTVTTSAQTAGLGYTSTVGDTVTDQTGTAVAAFARSASFVGYVVPAVLRLTELAPRLAFSRDLVELEVVSGGSVAGGKLLEQGNGSDVVLATFPAATLATGDLVVVHFVPLSDTGDAGASETTSKTQYAAANNYPNAWDFLTSSGGLSASSSVIRVVDRLGRTQDAIPFVDPSSQSTEFFSALQALQAEGRWLPASCSGSPCTNVTTPRASAISVNWSTVGTTVTGNSVQRKLGASTSTNADWIVGPSTFGIANSP